ncbi:hypothetical protein PV10_04981 [Exophiala mesophila]|uniref:Zn(2)-C6 fungal-type domain-containing protein n=1 Tax=Exophiala mesophila TaxID=212818 RepID=A0A0D1ZGI0_EXOME|nr:uncharacterized protein PV10_04981 [Exophiala mesophila]KIV93792.1 hypothetical protein PV10_04981 [Exophiala mesophila]
MLAHSNSISSIARPLSPIPIFPRDQLNAHPSQHTAQFQHFNVKTSTPHQRPILTPPYAEADAGINVHTSTPAGSSNHSSPASQTQQTSPLSMTDVQANVQTKSDSGQSAKPKRVRTGCLTCRERHLKCDEGLPDCLNCKKSNRKCKRGVRLNFIDIQCVKPPYLLPATHDWKVVFQDDSRDIASEYKGGLALYPDPVTLDPEPKRPRLDSTALTYDYTQIAAPVLSHQQLPGAAPYATPFPDQYATSAAQPYGDNSSSMPAYAEPAQTARQPFNQHMLVPTAQAQTVACLDDPNEVLYMQVFVEEVALWMDSMDAGKHFSRLIPFQALREPMLKYASLACGVRHLTLVNPIYPEEHALNYYNSATQLLLKSLQNPDRDSVLCATTATILNVYEVMSEKALQRMNHIAGARALIKECRWDATATGIGAACFWLNVGLELFSCLHFNWGVAWDPDTWGIDMTMNPQMVGGNEDDWTHKILWILSKITNFRSTAQPRYPDGSSVHAEQLRLHQRHQVWMGLKQFCERWHRCIPPTMHALAYVPPYLNTSKSAFPEVWLLKRTTIVAQLFYHTAMALLGAVHPMSSGQPQTEAEMQEMRVYHSRQICGIVAHVKDRGVASASIRCLAVAGENLNDRREQEEVLKIFDRIKNETGWRVAFINDDLKEKWGWITNEYDTRSSISSGYYPTPASTAPAAPTPAPARPKYPVGIVNPLYKNADFSAQNPPYQGNYVPPTPGHIMHSTTNMYGFSSIPAL